MVDLLQEGFVGIDRGWEVPCGEARRAIELSFGK